MTNEQLYLLNVNILERISKEIKESEIAASNTTSDDNLIKKYYVYLGQEQRAFHGGLYAENKIKDHLDENPDDWEMREIKHLHFRVLNNLIHELKQENKKLLEK